MKKTVFTTLCALFVLIFAFDVVMICVNASSDGNITVVAAAETPRGPHPDFAAPTPDSIGDNLAPAADCSASSYVAGYPASKANDGDIQASYWEGNAPFPQTLTLDFPAPTVFDTVRVCLRASAEWGTRVQRFSVLADGVEVAPAADYTFDYSVGNFATISFSAVEATSVSLVFESNTGAKGGQVAEFEVYKLGE